MLEDLTTFKHTTQTLDGSNFSDTLMITLSMSRMRKCLMLKEEKMKRLPMSKFGRKMDQRLNLGSLNTLKMRRRKFKVKV
jgi:hypothetical protein